MDTQLALFLQFVLLQSLALHWRRAGLHWTTSYPRMKLNREADTWRVLHSKYIVELPPIFQGVTLSWIWLIYNEVRLYIRCLLHFYYVIKSIYYIMYCVHIPNTLYLYLLYTTKYYIFINTLYLYSSCPQSICAPHSLMEPFFRAPLGEENMNLFQRWGPEAECRVKARLKFVL